MRQRAARGRKSVRELAGRGGLCSQRAHRGRVPPVRPPPVDRCRRTGGTQHHVAPGYLPLLVPALARLRAPERTDARAGRMDRGGALWVPPRSATTPPVGDPDGGDPTASHAPGQEARGASADRNRADRVRRAAKRHVGGSKRPLTPPSPSSEPWGRSPTPCTPREPRSRRAAPPTSTPRSANPSNRHWRNTPFGPSSARG